MDTHMDHRANRGEQEAGQQRTHTHTLCAVVVGKLWLLTVIRRDGR